MKDKSLLEQLETLPEQLVFILGCHRSGTTFLYQSLVESNYFNYISTYDILKYDELLYNQQNNLTATVQSNLEKELSKNGENREIDHCSIGVQKAEEYGFILPKNKEKFLFQPQLIPDNIEKFIEMCQKKNFLYPENKPLLLKNPDDFYNNYLYIHRSFPQAKLIFIHRHPLLVLNSQIIAWRKMLNKKNDYFARMHSLYDRLFEDSERLLKLRMLLLSEQGVSWMLSEFLKSFNYYLNHLSQLEQGSYYVVRYEDLCKQPEHYFQAVYTFLNLNPPEISYSSMVKPRHVEILPEVKKVYNANAGKFQDYLSHLNYTPLPL